MRSNTLLKQRNTSIYEQFEQMFKEGKRPDFIYDALSLKFFLVPKTVAKIVYAEANKRGLSEEKINTL